MTIAPGTSEVDEHSEAFKVTGVAEDTDAEEDLMDGFRVMDRDDNGCTTAAVLIHFCKNLGDETTYEEVDEEIRGADADRDAQVNQEEYAKML